MSNKISFNNISNLPETAMVSSFTSTKNDGSLFHDIGELSEKDKKEIETEILNKQKEYDKLSIRLKYLQGDSVLVQEKEQKRQKAEKLAGISGGLIGGIGTGALFIAGTSLVADAGIALTLCLAAPAAIIGAGIVGGIAAGITGLIIAKNKTNEEKHRQEEILQINEQLEKLSNDINILQSKLAVKI